MWLNIAILFLVTAQRLVELYIARRNTKRLLARGAHEAGSGHYWLIVVFHAAWLIGLWILARDNSVAWVWLFIFLAIETTRVWVVAALGERWTTRIIVLPGEPLVARGPYRYLRHPNYIVVALEIFVLPMVFGMFWYALAGTIINAAILYWRIRVEEETFKEAAPPAESQAHPHA